MIKLFCTDFDNTLGKNGKITDENINTIIEMQNKGLEIAIVTGRLASNIKGVAKKYGIKPHIVAANGAVTLKNGDELVGQDSIKLETTLKIISEAFKNRWYFFIYDRTRCFIPKNRFTLVLRPWLLKKLSEKLNAEIIPLSEDCHEFIELNTEATKINIFPPKKDVVKLREKFGEMQELYVTYSNSRWIEIMASGVSKWKGILRLAEVLRINESEIAAIGDYNNDIPMIENAEIGFAVGNASDEVKEIADRIVSTVDSSGVAEAIRIALNEK